VKWSTLLGDNLNAKFLKFMTNSQGY
jgi:hypothetical protein